MWKEFQDHDEWFDLGDDNDCSAILEDIINGEKHINPAKEEIHLSYLEEVTTTYSAFIPISFSNDFPHVLSIVNANLETMKAEFLETEIEGCSEEDMALYTKHFTAIFDQAIADKLDLVLFKY
ncbi:MAG: hypothetical protein ACRBFS_14830 [Aureispira sp.]